MIIMQAQSEILLCLVDNNLLDLGNGSSSQLHFTFVRYLLAARMH